MFKSLIFQDQANKTALPVIHLIDAMRNGIINYDVVKSGKELTLQVTEQRPT